jgi:magnesium-transporting ATPase (P-type)
MYRQRVLVKSLQIVETFNAVSLIATDKTGTLTQNKMTVTHLLWDTHGAYKVPVSDPEPVKEETIFQTLRRLSSGAIDTARRMSVVHRLSTVHINRPQRGASINLDNVKNNISDVASEIPIEAFRDLLLGASLCNNAEKQIVQDAQLGQDISKMKSELRLVGDAADVALYNLCVDRCFVDIDKVRNINPRLKVLPFNSSNKFMISANQLESSDPERTILITLKGAPDIVIQRCSSYKTNEDEILPLTGEIKQTLFNRQEELGENDNRDVAFLIVTFLGKTGYRVIAMCQEKFTQQKYDGMMQRYNDEQRSRPLGAEDLSGFPSSGYCFIGLFSLLDPPRPEVPDAVLKARRAQIRVAMVTGDHPTTAKAIAKQVNILTPEIAEMNGVDTFKMQQNANGQSVLNLYRNNTFLEQHVPGQVTKFDPGNKNAKAMMKQAQIDAGEAVPEREPPWYKRAWSSCKNQFREPKSDLPTAEKMSYIPYGIVVSDCL